MDILFLILGYVFSFVLGIVVMAAGALGNSVSAYLGGICIMIATGTFAVYELSVRLAPSLFGGGVITITVSATVAIIVTGLVWYTVFHRG